MSPKKKRPATDPYKRGYANGIAAAVDAVLDDLEELDKANGVFDEIEYDEDGRATTCKGCMLRNKGHHALATRWEFALGIHEQHR
jgi:hypothetical protein